MMMIVLRLLSLLSLKFRWHRHFSPRPLNEVFFQGVKWRDSWTHGPKPMCYRHPTGPHPGGLLWTPAKGASTKTNFALVGVPAQDREHDEEADDIGGGHVPAAAEPEAHRLRFRVHVRQRNAG